MIRRPPRSTQSRSSAASDVYKRQLLGRRSGLTLGQRYDHVTGALWWFNDALTVGFTVFVAATAVAAIIGRPFVVQRLTGLGVVLPIVFIVLNLVRYLWALRAATGASPALALAALRVNLSLSWVVALACLRGLTQERGVFLPVSYTHLRAHETRHDLV